MKIQYIVVFISLPAALNYFDKKLFYTICHLNHTFHIFPKGKIPAWGKF